MWQMFLFEFVAVAVLFVGVTPSVSSGTFYIPFQSPDKCNLTTVEDAVYATYFSSIKMQCLPCAQNLNFQAKSSDGVLKLFMIFSVVCV